MDNFAKKLAKMKSKISVIKVSADFASLFMSSGQKSAAEAHINIVKKECIDVVQSITTLERLNQAKQQQQSFRPNTVDQIVRQPRFGLNTVPVHPNADQPRFGLNTVPVHPNVDQPPFGFNYNYINPVEWDDEHIFQTMSLDGIDSTEVGQWLN